MSDYGDQWRERRRTRQNAIASYCLCGASLLKNQKICCRCNEPNPDFKEKVKK